MIETLLQWGVPLLLWFIVSYLWYQIGYKKGYENGYTVAEMIIHDRSIEIDGQTAYIGIINKDIERVLIATPDKVNIYRKEGEI